MPKATLGRSMLRGVLPIAVALHVLACGFSTSPKQPSREGTHEELAQPARSASPETDEVSGVGFTTRIASKAQWEQAPTTRGSKAAHNYVGSSSATPGVRYSVTSYTIADLQPDARKAGLQKVLAHASMELGRRLGCTESEVQVMPLEKARAKEKFGFEFEQSYAVSLECSATQGGGIGFAHAGSAHWLVSFALSGPEAKDAPAETVLAFFRSIKER